MPSVFDRLYSNHTQSSAAKRQPGAEKVHVHVSPYDSASHSTGSSSGSSDKKGTGAGTNAQKTTGVSTSDDDSAQEEGDEDGDGGDDALFASLSPTNILLYERDKPHAKPIILSCRSLNISQNDLRQATTRAGQERIAYAVIEALFQRDFRPGKRWDIDGATVTALPVPETETNSVFALFEVEKSATWDWKDIYSVAQAKGRIRFSSTTAAATAVPASPASSLTIIVEDYSYYVAG